MPKDVGGLGLRDLEALCEALGAKLRWPWVMGGKEIWRQIWKRKYKPQSTQEACIQDLNYYHESQFWIWAQVSMKLVRDHAFWEVKKGDITRIWEESW